MMVKKKRKSHSAFIQPHQKGIRDTAKSTLAPLHSVCLQFKKFARWKVLACPSVLPRLMLTYGHWTRTRDQRPSLRETIKHN